MSFIPFTLGYIVTFPFSAYHSLFAVFLTATSNLFESQSVGVFQMAAGGSRLLTVIKNPEVVLHASHISVVQSLDFSPSQFYDSLGSFSFNTELE